MDSSNLEATPRQLKIGVITLFPELFREFMDTSFVGRARRAGLLDLELIQLRDFGLGRHRSVDDTPYGGGSGMVMRVDCIVAALEETEARWGRRARRVLLTPQGQKLQAKLAEELSQTEDLLLLCGRYEGFDERVRAYVDLEISLGDFVLTGGEIPAMALIEAAIRFVPGVLGNEDSASEESFSPELDGGLEYPQYTRPQSFRGLEVPEILSTGHHENVAQWRRAESLKRTAQRRPDLLGTLARRSGDDSPGDES